MEPGRFYMEASAYVLVPTLSADLPPVRGDLVTTGREPIATFFTMSMTQRPSGASAPSPDSSPRTEKAAEDALDDFEDDIWHNGGVCSHCFARLRSYTELERNDWGHIVEETSYSQAAEEGFDLDDPAESVSSVYPLARERIVCGDCGSVGGLAASNTLSLDEAVDRVSPLVRRLREQGYSVNSDRVYSVVRYLKTQEEYRNDDKRIFAVAAYLGRQDT